MDLYLEPPGFLGTGASLLADITFIVYLLLIIPAILIGSWLAWRGKHRPHHKWLMIGVTAANWFFIVFLMIAAYRFDVAGTVGAQPSNLRYLMPVVHGVLGLPAQLLATYIVIRMLQEDYNVARAKARGERNTSQYWFKGAKWTMRVVFYLWLIVSVLGIFSYLVRYEILTT